MIDVINKIVNIINKNILEETNLGINYNKSKISSEIDQNPMKIEK